MMKNVTFHDVLLKLAHQAIKLHYQKEDIKKMQS